MNFKLPIIATLSLLSALTGKSAVVAVSEESQQSVATTSVISSTDGNSVTPDYATTEPGKRKYLPAVGVEVLSGGAICVAITEVMKNAINEPRPNGEDNHGMPSRHCSWLFTGTTLLSLELSSYTPWVAFGSYAVGSAMGMQRVMSKNHYPGEVFAGAAVGTFSGVVGYVISNIAFGNAHKYSPIKDYYFDYTPCLTLETGADFPLKREFGAMDLGTGISTSLLLTLPRGDHWGFTGRLMLRSAPIKSNLTGEYLEPLNRVAALVGINGEFAPWDGPISLGATVEGGYMHTLSTSLVSTSSASPVIKGNISVAVPVTNMLTITLTGGYELSRQRLNNLARGAQSATVALGTRAYF